MIRRRQAVVAVVSLIALVVALTGLLWAEETRQTISVTSTSQTITFPVEKATVSLYSCATSGTCTGNDTTYFRLFTCGSASAAATTSHTPLAAGEYIAFTHNAKSESGPGYCAVSIVAGGGDTATVRLIAK